MSGRRTIFTPSPSDEDLARERLEYQQRIVQAQANRRARRAGGFNADQSGWERSKMNAEKEYENIPHTQGGGYGK